VLASLHLDLDFGHRYLDSAETHAPVSSTQVCSLSDTVEALTHLLEQHSQVTKPAASTDAYAEQAFSKSDLEAVANALSMRTALHSAAPAETPLDARIFSKLLKTVLSSEGDHVLHRALQAYPLIKQAAAAPGSRSKYRKKQRVRSSSMDELDLDAEVSRLAAAASTADSLQVLLIFAKLLLCSLDQAAVLTLSAAPLRQLATSSLPDWSTFIAVLQAARQQERMQLLRGNPGISLLYGRGGLHDRWEARGKVLGVVSGVSIASSSRGQHYYEAELLTAGSDIRIGWAAAGAHFCTEPGEVCPVLGNSGSSWCIAQSEGLRRYHNAAAAVQRLRQQAEHERTERKLKRREDTATTATAATADATVSEEQEYVDDFDDDDDDDDETMGLGGLFLETPTKPYKRVEDGGELIVTVAVAAAAAKAAATKPAAATAAVDSSAAEVRWQAGTVIGCLLDLDAADGGAMHFYVSGKRISEQPVFAGFAADQCCFVPAFSCGAQTQGVRLNIGETPFKHQPRLPMRAVLQSEVSQCLSLSGKGAATVSGHSISLWGMETVVIEAIVKPVSVSSEELQCVFSIAGSAAGPGLSLSLQGSKVLVSAHAAEGAAVQRESASSLLTQGHWAQLSLRLTPGRVALYLDGAQVYTASFDIGQMAAAGAATAAAAAAKQPAVAAIGALCGTDAASLSQHFHGEIAQVRVWSYGSDRVEPWLMQGRKPELEASSQLSYLWKLEEGEGALNYNSCPTHSSDSSGHAVLSGEWQWVECFSVDAAAGEAALLVRAQQLAVHSSAAIDTTTADATTAAAAPSDSNEKEHADTATAGITAATTTAATAGSTASAASAVDTLLVAAAHAAVSAETVSAEGALMCVMSSLHRHCSQYLEPSGGDVQREASVRAVQQLQMLRSTGSFLGTTCQPHVLTFMLLHSLLWQVAQEVEGMRPQDPSSSSSSSAAQGSAVAAVAAGSDSKAHMLLSVALALLRVLRANLYHLSAAGIAPGTCGLAAAGSAKDRARPFAVRLLGLLLDSVGGVLDVSVDAPLLALQTAVRREAADTVAVGLHVFYPTAAATAELLAALLQQCSHKLSAPLQASSSSVAAAADSSVADLDDLGCKLLLASVVTGSSQLLLDAVVPQLLRPVLTSCDVHTYLRSCVQVNLTYRNHYIVYAAVDVLLQCACASTCLIVLVVTLCSKLLHITLSDRNFLVKCDSAFCVCACNSMCCARRITAVL
jgi:SPRY domain